MTKMDKIVRERISQCRRDHRTTLDLSGLALEKVQPEVFDFAWLRSIDLRDNYLIALPPEIGNLGNL